MSGDDPKGAEYSKAESRFARLEVERKDERPRGRAIEVSRGNAVKLWRLSRLSALQGARGWQKKVGAAALDAVDELAARIRGEFGSGLLVDAEGREYPPIRDEIKEIEEGRIV